MICKFLVELGPKCSWQMLLAKSSNQFLKFLNRYISKTADQSAWFFAYWDKLKEDKNWFENFKSQISIIFLNEDSLLINEIRVT